MYKKIKWKILLNLYFNYNEIIKHQNKNLINQQQTQISSKPQNERFESVLICQKEFILSYEYCNSVYSKLAVGDSSSSYRCSVNTLLYLMLNDDVDLRLRHCWLQERASRLWLYLTCGFYYYRLVMLWFIYGLLICEHCKKFTLHNFRKKHTKILLI